MLHSKTLLQLRNLFLVITIAAGFSSCISNKQLVYFPDPRLNTDSLINTYNVPGVYRLQPRDVLSIKIKTLDAQSSEYFNMQSENGVVNLNPASIYVSGYSVNDSGAIELPEIGALGVAGLTVNEAQNKIEKALEVYLKKATIIVKLVSFKITILGEVRSPGYYYVYNDQATVLEGLGLAGDLTDFGNRENITIIRQNDDGVGAVLVNLKDPKFLASPYYFLKPNDVIYIQPVKAKNTRGNLGTLGFISVIFGGVSAAVLFLNYLQN